MTTIKAADPQTQTKQKNFKIVLLDLRISFPCVPCMVDQGRPQDVDALSSLWNNISDTLCLWLKGIDDVL